ncbi:hypothetical protein EMCG_00494 [[Emmonsia] crescens]|uniref:Uncharacterized protein n=1 Tax=[Emmonsia] crescens TaxID=73230 RepID=A0A0G2HUT3_9EURO|nr:hypothetical protein EMCG_00494 [Emmonsia crescens UAMH 3008]
MAATVCMELEDLGRSRPTLTDQRAYLADFSSSGYDIFAERMDQHGHQYVIQEAGVDEGSPPESETSDFEQLESMTPKVLSREEAIEMVVRILEQCRGRAVSFQGFSTRC